MIEIKGTAVLCVGITKAYVNLHELDRVSKSFVRLSEICAHYHTSTKKKYLQLHGESIIYDSGGNLASRDELLQDLEKKATASDKVSIP